MASWHKELLPRENGELVEMQVPEIVSASRSTDIPAFYADWFFHRLKVGYSAWKNPFNGVKGYVSYKNTCFIVFWSKNPSPLLTHLDELKERGIGCYIQYTLNDYVKEGLEKGVKPLAYRIDTFKRLVDKLGVGSVIWRFDPLMLTDTIDIETLLEKIENIGNQLKGYTEKLVFSYADIALYRKVKSNLEKNGIKSEGHLENDAIVVRDIAICIRLIDIFMEDDAVFNTWLHQSFSGEMKFRKLKDGLFALDDTDRKPITYYPVYVNVKNEHRFFRATPIKDAQTVGDRDRAILSTVSLRQQKALHLYHLIREYNLLTWWD